MAKGDYATVVYAVGNLTNSETITADQNGRRIEVNVGSKWLDVAEVTRGGTEVRKATYRLDAVLSYTTSIKEEK